MAKSDSPYPTFDNHPKPKQQRPTWGGAARFALAVLGVLTSIVLLFMIAVKLSDSKGCFQPEGTGGVVVCEGEADRERWLYATEKRVYDRSPQTVGFRLDGKCNLKIESRMLSCDVGTVADIARDSPYFRSALAHGFQIYVCINVSTKARVEIPLNKIVSGSPITATPIE